MKWHKQCISFSVPIRAVPGSNTKRPVVAGNGKMYVVDKAKGKDKLFATVRMFASKAAKEQGWDLAEGPIALNITFFFARPKNHFGKGRNAKTLKPSAPIDPINRGCGDRTNLLKCIEDALTGVLWNDDSQVVGGNTVKAYGDVDIIHINVAEVENRS